MLAPRHFFKHFSDHPGPSLVNHEKKLGVKIGLYDGQKLLEQKLVLPFCSFFIVFYLYKILLPNGYVNLIPIFCLNFWVEKVLKEMSKKMSIEIFALW